MKKLLLSIACFTLLLTACNNSSNDKRGDKTNTQEEVITNNQDPVNTNTYNTDSDDWEGEYVGTLPCADCEGIKMNVKLNEDGTFYLKEDYIKKQIVSYEYNGNFKWNDDGSRVILHLNDNDERTFKLDNNQLIMVGDDGKVATGALADKYVLRKINM